MNFSQIVSSASTFILLLSIFAVLVALVARNESAEN